MLNFTLLLLNWLLIQKQNHVRFPSSYIVPTASDEVLKLKDPNFCLHFYLGILRPERDWISVNSIEQFVDIVAKEIKI